MLIARISYLQESLTVHAVTQSLVAREYNEYLAVVEAFSDFDPKRRASRIRTLRPANLLPMIEALKAAAILFSVDAQVTHKLQALASEGSERAEVLTSRLSLLQVSLAAQGKALYPYQRYGIEWLSGRSAGLLADEMGLGKTMQALLSLPERARAIVICPAVAVGVWIRELGIWRGDLRANTPGSFAWPGERQVNIMSYHKLPGEDSIVALPGVSVIFDEAHAFKNPATRRAKGARRLAKAVLAADGRAWLLTATPLLGKPDELWTVLGTAGLETEAYGSKERFRVLMGGARVSVPGMRGKLCTAWGTPQQSALDCLRRVSLRRARSEVLADIPAKRYQDIHVELTREAIEPIDMAVALLSEAGWSIERLVKFLEYGEKKAKIPFDLFSSLRAALSAAKIPAMLEQVQAYEDASEPAIVFSSHRAPVLALSRREGWELITGDTPAHERTEIEESYQAGTLRGIGATIGAGGVAITLTRGAFVLFCGQDWTPAINAQAEDRACRLGQTRCVLVQRLVSSHPVDVRVSAVLARKQALFDSMITMSAQNPAPSEGYDPAVMAESGAK